MGMAASQVRLLSLTARMHGIEFETKKLEAQKLKLSADSGRAYAEYLNALDMTKLQYKTISPNGAIIYRDATLNAMENGIIDDYKGDTCVNTLFLQDVKSGKILVTPALAKAYGLTTAITFTEDMDSFVTEETGKEKIRKPIYQTITISDQNDIAAFETVDNVVNMPYEEETSYVYNPVITEEGGINQKTLNSYAKFNNTHSNVDNTVYKIDESSDLNDIISAGTCQIDSAEGLKQLEKLSHENAFSSATINIILSDNIDMSEYENWAGIRNFRGMFDGNGYIISNLSGIQGLFADTTSATVKNTGLENINIKGTLSYTGGLIGYAKTTNISNCYTTGSVTSETASSIKSLAAADNTIYSCGTGGLVGLSFVERDKNITFDNVYSTADVKGNDGVGGLIGSSMTDHTNTNFNITNAYATGNVAGNNGVGGFAGTMFNDEDNPDGFANIEKCYAGGNVLGTNDVGGFFGAYLFKSDENNPGCTISNCNCSGKVTGLNSNIGSFAGHLYIQLESATTNTSDNYLITLENCNYPNKEENSNAYGIITNEKEETTVTTGNILNRTTKNIEEFVLETKSDTNPDSNNDNEESDSEIKPVNRESNIIFNKGNVKTPSAATIAEEVYLSMLKNNITTDKETVLQYFKQYDTDNAADRVSLANINDKICRNSNLDVLYQAILDNDYKYNDDTKWGDTSVWEISVSEKDTPVRYTTNKTEQKQIIGYDEYWNTNDKDISKSITRWLLSQRGFEVVTKEQASSNRWFSNIIKEGAAALTTFNPENIVNLAGYPAEDIAKLSEDEYNFLMGIEPVNLETESYLNEVSDELNIKKAEAQYEANMRMIDLKDKRFDIQIAYLASERQAVKEEIDTLKFEINDNTKRAFKLFT